MATEASLGTTAMPCTTIMVRAAAALTYRTRTPPAFYLRI